MRQFSCVLEPLLAPTHDSQADLIDPSRVSDQDDSAAEVETPSQVLKRINLIKDQRGLAVHFIQSG